MKGARRYLGLMLLPALLALSGCSTSVERTVYDTLVNLQQQRRPCVAPVPTDCPKSPSYDQYRRERATTRTGGSRASQVPPPSPILPKSPSYDRYRRERDTTRTGGSRPPRVSPPSLIPR